MYSRSISFIAIAASILLSVQGMELTEDIIKRMGECQAKFKITGEEIVAGVTARKLPESENGKCFLECMMDKFGLLKDGKLDTEQAHTLIASKFKSKPETIEKANTVLEKCNSEVKNPGGKCNYGVELARCGMKYAKELGIDSPMH